MGPRPCTKKDSDSPEYNILYMYNWFVQNPFMFPVNHTLPRNNKSDKKPRMYMVQNPMQYLYQYLQPGGDWTELPTIWICNPDIPYLGSYWIRFNMNLNRVYLGKSRQWVIPYNFFYYQSIIS